MSQYMVCSFSICSTNWHSSGLNHILHPVHIVFSSTIEWSMFWDAYYLAFYFPCFYLNKILNGRNAKPWIWFPWPVVSFFLTDGLSFSVFWICNGSNLHHGKSETKRVTICFSSVFVRFTGYFIRYLYSEMINLQDVNVFLMK